MVLCIMLKNELYVEDLKKVNMSDLNWNNVEGSNILVTGGTGLIGSCLVDVLIYRNEYLKAHIGIWVLCRSKERAEDIFGEYLEKPYLHMVYQDVSSPIEIEEDMDYIVHAASKGDPKSFVSDPLGVMNANILGIYQLLKYTEKQKLKKFVYISSGEVYGQLQNIEEITETMMGTLDTMNVRNCYGVSKRAAETMCVSAYAQFGIPIVVGRLCHTYGPTMMKDENRVVFQFIQNAIDGNDIVLKSAGMQRRSYCYVSDAVKGILTLLMKGSPGQAYNIANKESVISIRELAECIAGMSGRCVIMSEQNETEKIGNSGIMHAVLSNKKLCELGISFDYNIVEGIERTITILGKTYERDRNRNL